MPTHRARHRVPIRGCASGRRTDAPVRSRTAGGTVDRWTRVLTVTVVAAGTVLVAPPEAGAAENGLLRLAHLSPDTPAVDVYVDPVSDPGDGPALLTVPGVGYGTISDYQDVPEGVYTVSVRRAGADPGTPPVQRTQSLSPGRSGSGRRRTSTPTSSRAASSSASASPARWRSGRS